jgi:hypothetical protein
VGSVRAFLQRGEDAEAVLREISAINLELLARRHLIYTDTSTTARS